MDSKEVSFKKKWDTKPTTTFYLEERSKMENGLPKGWRPYMIAKQIAKKNRKDFHRSCPWGENKVIKEEEYWINKFAHIRRKIADFDQDGEKILARRELRENKKNVALTRQAMLIVRKAQLAHILDKEQLLYEKELAWQDKAIFKEKS